MPTPHSSRWLAAGAVATAALVLFAGSPVIADAADADPTRLVLTPTEDPATSQSFTWRTPVAEDAGAVHLRVAGTTEWRVMDAHLLAPLDPAFVHHSVTVDALEPGTTYEYWVGTDEAASDYYEFTTSTAAGDPFTFIYFGDAQNDLAAQWAPVVEQAFDRYPGAVGTVNAGDLINSSNNDSEWDDWFGAMDGYSQTSNVIAAPGNHEYTGDAFLRNWKANFEYPLNGPQVIGGYGDSAGEAQRQAYEEQMVKALEETAYYTDYQGVRFISINASRSQAVNIFTPDELPNCVADCPNPIELWLDMQANWVDQMLADNPHQWAVAVFHQPVFSTSEGRNEVDLRRALLPVFQENNIDLVLQGHDHTYARGYVADDATSIDGVTAGPVYAVAVAGPKYYDLQPEGENVWTANGAVQVTRAAQTSTYQGITVDGDTLSYESIVARKGAASSTNLEIGETLDSFSITKYDDGTKCVVEEGVTAPGPGVCEHSYESDGGEGGPAPVEVPLGHEVVDQLDLDLTAAGPLAFDEDHGTLFIADAQEVGARIVEVDAVTGAELREFPLNHMPVDMAFGANERALLLGFAEGYVGAYSADPWSFGEPVIDETPVSAGITGVTFDAWRAVGYVAVDAGAYGAILALDLESGDLLSQTVTAGGIGAMDVDPASGLLYATYGSDIGARVFSTLEDMAVVDEYALDGDVSAVSIDRAAGLVYFAHGGDGEAGGLSVVDRANGQVSRLEGPKYGSAVQGVALDTNEERVYIATAAGDPAQVVVAERWEAPVVTRQPMGVSVDEGDEVVLTALATGVPVPTVQWERKVAGGTWASVSSADSADLTFNATEHDAGAAYRAVFTSTMGEEKFTAVSSEASLMVALDDSGDGGDGGDGGGGDGGDSDGSQAPDESDLNASNMGNLTIPGVITLGVPTSIGLGSGFAGQDVTPVLFSEPLMLGTHSAAGDGSIVVTVPIDAPTGAHRLAIYGESGEVIGWAPVTLVAPVETLEGEFGSDSGDLASTGAEFGPWVATAVLLLVVGSALVIARRRVS
ncbi:fibronectin type III domain-containing protein [Demequina aurantiaca]|uniref:fibronectin type III domain-containing protein n=1 Tax=Demequina aurantiaca TaxID=676200 RepID=UPI003D34BB7C